MGAIMVSVPASITRPIWETVDLGGDYAISFVRDDGMLVARYPLPATTLDMSGYILFTKYLKEAPAGTYRAETSPMDGVRRVVAYRRVEGTPFIAVAAEQANLPDLCRRSQRLPPRRLWSRYCPYSVHGPHNPILQRSTGPKSAPLHL